MPELPVCQTARNGHPVILPIDFHLPGGIVHNLRTPEDIVPVILYHKPGKIMIDRHGSRLTKPF